MKIGLLLQELRNGGGAYQLLHLAQELTKQHHTIYIYTMKDSLTQLNPELTKDLIIRTLSKELKINPAHGQLVGFLAFVFYQFRLCWALANLADQDELNLVNPHEWPMQWAGVLIKWRKKIPVVWMCNDVWQIGKYNLEKRVVFKIGDRTIIPVFDLFLTRFVDQIVVLDHRIQKIILQHYQKKSVVVRSGLDLELFEKIPTQTEARKKTELPQDMFIFLCMSIFLKHRRFEDVVVAFKKLKEANPTQKMLLVIAGSDKYEKEYADAVRKIADEVGIADQVQFRTEYLPEVGKRLLLSAADVFIFPNQNQTWGIIVTEAMASGLPCIVSNGAGVHEIIQNQENGLIFKVRNIDQLSNEMERLLTNPQLKNKIGQQARKYVFENISWQKYGQSMINIFGQILASEKLKYKNSTL